jgi:DNA repair exonuclease SbcCD ATPase subunit
MPRPVDSTTGYAQQTQVLDFRAKLHYIVHARPKRSIKILALYSSSVACKESRALELSISLQNLQTQWPEIIKAMRSQDLRLQALLRAGQPVAVIGNTIFVQFRYDYHTKQVSEERNRGTLEEMLGQFIGQPVYVHCLLPGESPPKLQVKMPDRTSLGIQAEQKPNQAIRSEIAQLQDERQRLEESLNKLRTASIKEQAMLQSLIHDTETHRREVERLESRQSELAEQNMRLELNIRTLGQQSQALNQEITQLQAEKASVEESVASLSSIKDKLTAELSELELTKQRLEERGKTKSPVDLPPIEGIERVIGRSD